MCHWIKNKRNMSLSIQEPLPHSDQLTWAPRVLESGWLSSPLTCGSTGAAQSCSRILSGITRTSPGLMGTPLTVWVGGRICHCWAAVAEPLSVASADTGCLNRGSVKQAFVTEEAPTHISWGHQRRQDGTEVTHHWNISHAAFHTTTAGLRPGALLGDSKC